METIITNDVKMSRLKLKEFIKSLRSDLEHFAIELHYFALKNGSLSTYKEKANEKVDLLIKQVQYMLTSEEFTVNCKKKEINKAPNAELSLAEMV
ncbi:MAG: hypothetical protein ACUZ8E_08910 [Candidatus Anammoxibacter sp.]